MNISEEFTNQKNFGIIAVDTLSYFNIFMFQKIK